MMDGQSNSQTELEKVNTDFDQKYGTAEKIRKIVNSHILMFANSVISLLEAKNSSFTEVDLEMSYSILDKLEPLVDMTISSGEQVAKRVKVAKQAIIHAYAELKHMSEEKAKAELDAIALKTPWIPPIR